MFVLYDVLLLFTCILKVFIALRNILFSISLFEQDIPKCNEYFQNTGKQQTYGQTQTKIIMQYFSLTCSIKTGFVEFIFVCVCPIRCTFVVHRKYSLHFGISCLVSVIRNGYLSEEV